MIQFSDFDVVDIEDFEPGEDGRNPVRPWLFHDHGFAVAVVFADCLLDALDKAVDGGKMNRYLIPTDASAECDCDESPLSLEDYPDLFTEEEAGISRLGNAGEPHDIESLGYIELQNPPMSFAALFKSATPDKQTAISSHFA
jgi:hypothetical protein